MITVVNASQFHCIHTDSYCDIYSASPGDPARTGNTIEEALHAKRWREICAPFAVITINKQTGEFVLVRDHLGIQPLYYCFRSEKLIFADTIPDILHHLSQTPPMVAEEVARLFSDTHHYSDTTLYEGIYRVEPGHMIYGKRNGVISKSAWWQLQREGDELHYADERDYLEHFSSLMDEAVQHATQGSRRCAAEFSAGLDSTAIYCAAAAQGLNPLLFMHAAIPESDQARMYNDHHERAFIAHYPTAHIHRIRAEHFDPVQVFREYAAWFGGPSPYIFELFAHTVHRAVSAQGCDILLSGFGGDQGVSGHVPTRFFLPSLIKSKQFRQAWSATATTGAVPRRLLLLAQCAHPALHEIVHTLRSAKVTMHNAFRQEKRIAGKHAYTTGYFNTLREAEWSFLQGPDSHEIRMRIEYSSIVAKKMGFEYRYPLLYLKLLEFFLSLPLAQKHHQGTGRYMMRRYLARHMPARPFDSYQKKEGLSILPATMDIFSAQFAAGTFKNDFQALPCSNRLTDPSPLKVMIKTIQAFMLKESGAVVG